MTQRAKTPAVPARRIACYPVDRRNPYQARYYEALAAYGYDCAMDSAARGWRLRDKIVDEDILHLHWGTEDFYHADNSFRAIRLLIRFVMDLVSLRARRKKVVWTCHNLAPHESPSRWADWVAHFALAQTADCVLTHAECIRRDVGRRYFRRRGVHVLPFGPYAGQHPVPATRSEARRALGIPEGAYVFLFLGQVREYKGVPDLVEAFRSVEKPGDVLLVAGRPVGEAMTRLLDDIAADSRVRVLRSGADEEIGRALSAANSLVLPFRRVTTSSSCFLGPAYQLPIILPDMTFFSEIFGADYPLLFKSGSVDDLARRMREARGMTVSDVAKWYDTLNRGLSWDAAAEKTARVLNGLFEDGR